MNNISVSIENATEIVAMILKHDAKCLRSSIKELKKKSKLTAIDKADLHDNEKHLKAIEAAYEYYK